MSSCLEKAQMVTQLMLRTGGGSLDSETVNIHVYRFYQRMPFCSVDVSLRTRLKGFAFHLD